MKKSFLLPFVTCEVLALLPLQLKLQSRKSTSQIKAIEYADTSCEKSILGHISRLRTADDDSFLTENEVPTFLASGGEDFEIQSGSRAKGLEGALRQGPAFLLDDVFSKETCDSLIDLFENELRFTNFQAGKNNHAAMQIVIPQSIADSLGKALSRHIDIHEVNARRIETEGNDPLDQDTRLLYEGLNRRWRVYRYSPGTSECFAPHIDAGFPPSGISDDGKSLLWDATHQYGEDVVSRLTVLIYLNDDFSAGETKFYQPLVTQSAENPEVIASIRPNAGSVLVFPQAVGTKAVTHARLHWPLHEGSPVRNGSRSKYVIRTDVLFRTQLEGFNPNDPYMKHDKSVRQAFKPHTSVFEPKFLHHVESLYNPHMGVENVGHFLYSWIRFTKVRKVVEIGAGYTSIWILQALRDNEEEMNEIKKLGRRGECLLMDIPWAIPSIVEQYHDELSSLLLVDNCKHQKETASMASDLAYALNLEKYLDIQFGDAFQLSLDPMSIDLLWCDFGVGSKMSTFCSQAWNSLRLGGFLICHSTLTNQGTREWLEAIRQKEDESKTGIPNDSYVEISLLEPHKRYQNSITILQKRKESGVSDFSEPVYSQFA
jgi:Methyltransferase domain